MRLPRLGIYWRSAGYVWHGFRWGYGKYHYHDLGIIAVDYYPYRRIVSVYFWKISLDIGFQERKP